MGGWVHCPMDLWTHDPWTFSLSNVTPTVTREKLNAPAADRQITDCVAEGLEEPEVATDPDVVGEKNVHATAKVVAKVVH